ncbi:MAG TPA: fibronectin type III domain-containing protein [Chthoniobacterales bacterium]|jgi:hypothetical protein
MIKPKLELSRLTDQEVIDLATLIAQSMGNEGTLFPAPEPPLTALNNGAKAITDLLKERANLQQQVTAKTLAIRASRDTLEALLTTEASTVDDIAKGDPTIIAKAGMTPSEEQAPVGPMPKVENLAATAGDEAGEIDLSWNPIRRGLKSYLIEQSASPDGQSDWTFAKVETKSKTTIAGLESGKRYWFRVKAIGASGEGPASDIATKLAP